MQDRHTIVQRFRFCSPVILDVSLESVEGVRECGFLDEGFDVVGGCCDDVVVGGGDGC